ncbi:unnamed protein product [Durusdinium trenchii]|uniref:Uncharacterized protein n=1 Tax=Durusdinium trenchii TaxID=1381693 RepID=A0ABP0K862_9DINO
MQQINVSNAEQAADLTERREIDAETHLTMCKKLYMKQVRRGAHVIIAISEVLSWERWTADVATAFLQGDPQQRILWARIPKDACELIGVPPGTLMRLIKPLYGQADAPRQWFAVARRRDKRTKIEVTVTKQKMLCMDTKLRWVSSEIQLADGVTKSSARQLFADRLRSHQISLRSDMTFQAAKKKTLAERQANARKHAISRSGNRHSLAYIILISQMMMVQAM